MLHYQALHTSYLKVNNIKILGEKHTTEHVYTPQKTKSSKGTAKTSWNQMNTLHLQIHTERNERDQYCQDEKEISGY